MSKPQKKLETVAAFLCGESTLALATANDSGVSAVAPVFYLVDDELTLYFLSSPASLHCQNLIASPTVAAAVYRHTDNWKEICGVQMRGLVTAITEPDRRRALLKLYCERFQLGAAARFAISRCTLYAFRPDFFRYMDNSKHFGYKFEVTRNQFEQS